MTVWRVAGYTAVQLAATSKDEVGAFERETELRAVEMVAHMLADPQIRLVTVQRVDE